VDILNELIQIVGKERASDDKTIRYTYSKDASVVTGMPDYVVQPIETKEVAEVMSFASKHKIPVTPRGAGSGTAGGCVPIHGGIVIDMSKMDKIIDIDIANLYVMVEAGVIEGKLNVELAKEGFFFAPDPASARFCTIGGVVANGAGGSGGLKYGVTKHHVLDLEVVLPDGTVIHTGSKVVKANAGYDLNSLFVGSEGTLGVVTQALLKILPLPESNSTVVAYFNDFEKPGEALLKILSKKIFPGACEILDSFAIECINAVRPVFQKAEAVLLFRLDGSEETVKKEAAVVVSSCQESEAFEVREATNKDEAEMLWLGRSSLAPALAHLGKPPILSYPYGADDYGVPPRRIPQILREVKRILQGRTVTFMTASHIGDGNLHTAGAIDPANEQECREAKEVTEEIFKAALAMEGTIACEHGIGATKIEWLKEEHKSSYPLMQLIKRGIDPANIMNPGKMFE
jgi:glycolate oxidase